MQLLQHYIEVVELGAIDRQTRTGTYAMQLFPEVRPDRGFDFGGGNGPDDSNPGPETTNGAIHVNGNGSAVVNPGRLGSHNRPESSPRRTLFVTYLCFPISVNSYRTSCCRFRVPLGGFSGFRLRTQGRGRVNGPHKSLQHFAACPLRQAFHRHVAPRMPGSRHRPLRGTAATPDPFVLGLLSRRTHASVARPQRAESACGSARQMAG